MHFLYSLDIYLVRENFGNISFFLIFLGLIKSIFRILKPAKKFSLLRDFEYFCILLMDHYIATNLRRGGGELEV